MARKKQEIKVVAHVPEDMVSVFGGTHAEEFWRSEERRVGKECT